MNGLQISYVINWSLLCLISFIVARILRKQIEFSKRMSNHGGELILNDHGLEIGTIIPIEDFRAIDSTQLHNNKERIILFSATHCDTCKSLYKVITKSLKPTDPEIVMFMFGSEESIRRIKKEFNLSLPLFSYSPDTDSLGVNMFPFAYYVSREGKILSKGFIAERGHVDILIKNANNRYVASA